MNKESIDAMIPKAVEALKEVKIAENGKINKTYRGQISTFGASIMNGSLLAAVAFFSDKGGASVDRTRLMKAICSVLGIDTSENALFNYVKNTKGDERYKCREDIINASIALKLAMNVYVLEGED